MKEEKKKGFGKLALIEFLIILVFGILAYCKIGDGSIQVDAGKLFDFSNTNSTSNDQIDDEEESEVDSENPQILVGENAEEDYKLVEELYHKAFPFLYSSVPIEYFKLGERDSEGYEEILNYDEAMKEIFTEKAIENWEEFYKELIKKEDGKVYIMAADGVIGLNYITRCFVKFEYGDNYIKCKADNIFYADVWNDIDSFRFPEIKHREADFVIKNVDGKWLVDEISR